MMFVVSFQLHDMKGAFVKTFFFYTAMQSREVDIYVTISFQSQLSDPTLSPPTAIHRHTVYISNSSTL